MRGEALVAHLVTLYYRAEASNGGYSGESVESTLEALCDDEQERRWYRDQVIDRVRNSSHGRFLCPECDKGFGTKYGMSRHRAYAHGPRFDIEEMVADRDAGLTHRELTAKYAVCTVTVQKVLERAGRK